jgi:hypothetical protein
LFSASISLGVNGGARPRGGTGRRRVAFAASRSFSLARFRGLALVIARVAPWRASSRRVSSRLVSSRTRTADWTIGQSGMVISETFFNKNVRKVGVAISEEV